ncbi:MAG TPA: glycosyltransferase family 4 protein [Terriglobales bacterium]|nr:glycosyltransferase family 4 protein [Terriglobales bacterium]
MRIAQVAPLYECVPPKLYGGTERIVSYLTEELVRHGHDVTLFASGDSLTNANLIPISPQALRLDTKCIDQLAHHVRMLEEVVAHQNEFDLIHFHIDYLHFPLTRIMGWTTLTTLHGRLDIPDLLPLYQEFKEMPVSSISNAQREPLPWLNWQGTAYHGLPKNQYEFSSSSKGYLAFLGRTSPEKGLDEAIAIARKVEMPLKIGAKVDNADLEYFEQHIKPLIEQEDIDFLGEIGFPEKNELLGGAAALLFPIRWPEPFGIVMIEAMACGTPVIAYSQGSVPEVLEDGVTGLFASDVDSASRAVMQLPGFDRARCRRRFEERFTSEVMCSQYLRMYQSLVRQEGETIAETSGVPIA